MNKFFKNPIILGPQNVTNACRTDEHVHVTRHPITQTATCQNDTCAGMLNAFGPGYY